LNQIGQNFEEAKDEEHRKNLEDLNLWFNADGLLPVKKRSFEFCNLGGLSFSAQKTQWFKQEPSELPNASYLLGFDYPSLAAVPCSSQPHLAQGTQLA